MIRPATRGDAAAIARVHVDSWKETYEGILPQASLDDLGYRGREAMWRGLDPRRTLVAEEDGGIVGFASFGPERNRDDLYTGELYTIYILRRHQGRGLGRALFAAAAGGLAADGHRAFLLWVLRGNPARAFYEHLGGTYLRSQPITIFGAEIAEDALGWRGLETEKG